MGRHCSASTSPPGQYLVFNCSGPLPGAVIEGWRAVWAFFERPDALRRAYTADFEVYFEPERVEIWIAVHHAGDA